ncbi:hypothetical protein HA402_006235 [Bradysia odoriphaga]|uniref:amyloid protein-binding protein 2 isoform X2 n=1 Tax=Bradysia coprophila TaxID=38358 RepID=UPI00187DC31C|nr:amyloid protein-binding protein 2 isoform X2 [Bradysia coprophila]KAG4079923.1 hypothetical protein HA402_006235 [Bradysia odoriphaga]
MAATKNPKLLYLQCLKVYANIVPEKLLNLTHNGYLELLPPMVLLDIFTEMSTVESLRDALLAQFGNINIFVKLLKFGGTKLKMFRCFSVLSSGGRPITNELVNQYNEQCDFMTLYHHQQTIPYDEESAVCIENGLRVGTFLAEAGWLQESLVVLDRVLSILNKLDTDKLETYEILLIKLDCLQRLLHAQAGICCFKKANVTCALAEQIIKKIGEDKIPDNLMASLYTKVSVLHYSRSDYNQSYEWSIKALKHCFQRTPHTITIDVFRQAAKSCVLKRYFSKAHLLIQEAVRTARIHLGKDDSKYADALLDFGFYLLNVDSIVQSVDVYKEALEIKQFIFGTRNLHVAIATEDMSYALYVRDYSTGRFQNALDHVENSIRILKSIVPSNHLMLASAKRVKALILEEIALDNSTEGSLDVHPLLLHAEELHQSALDLSLNVFGEMNVQTAKHYGNLGRLYQSMAKYYEAENMHKRAIKIKADILGEFDYEVGLSIGHLASLYNYHMKNYQEAERLYLRSINISLRLFGETYSGLEYDYRGLCYVYEHLNDTEKYLEYALILDTWKQLKEDQNRVNKISYESKVDSTIDDITKQFFNIGKDVI